MNTNTTTTRYADFEATMAKVEVAAAADNAKSAAMHEKNAIKAKVAMTGEKMKNRCNANKAKTREEMAKVSTKLKDITDKSLEYSAKAAEFISEKAREAQAKLNK